MMPFVIVLLAVLMAGCQAPDQGAPVALPPGVDLQGHRGCRGLMPENSLPGFVHALDLGVHTLEMDLCISADSQVVVSHEPWLAPDICADRTGARIAPDQRARYNLFALPYAEIRQHDCGSLPHPHFPQQRKLPTYKPLLAEVIDTAEAHARATGRALPWYNLEIKRVPHRDGIFHPEVEPFVRLVLAEVARHDMAQRCVIQSFDVETLQLVHVQAPHLPLALLVENAHPPEANLAQLGFTPAIYSPWFKRVDRDLMQLAASRGMAVIPWTVNDPADLRAMLELGVHGLITDYPDRIR